MTPFRKIDPTRLAALHAQNLTDGEIARTLGNVSKCGVRVARVCLSLPPNADAVRRAASRSGAQGAASRTANSAARTAALGLPPLSLSPIARAAVVALASGPLTVTALGAQLNCSTSDPNSRLAVVLRELRRANLVSSRSVYGGPTFRQPSVWSLTPSLFSSSALTPLQQRIAATPRALSIADCIASTYTLKLPHLEHDIRSAAHYALADAARRYDPSRYQFSTFAASRVRGAIQDTLRSIAPRGYTRNADSAPQTAAYEAGAEPADDRLAVGWELDSLDAVESLIRHLPCHPDRQVMRLYYTYGMTMREIADRLGMAESNVSFVHTRSIVRLRDHAAVAA